MAGLTSTQSETKMLDAFIIDQIKKKDEEERREPVPLTIQIELELEQGEELNEPESNRVIVL